MGEGQSGGESKKYYPSPPNLLPLEEEGLFVQALIVTPNETCGKAYAAFLNSQADICEKSHQQS